MQLKYDNIPFEKIRGTIRANRLKVTPEIEDVVRSTPAPVFLARRGGKYAFVKRWGFDSTVSIKLDGTVDGYIIIRD